MDALGLMCVHAHPDDETIGTGGVLAKAVSEGLRTAVVTCTDGALGEIVGPDMDPDEVRPRLAEVRRDELAAALAALGLGEPRFLGYRDSGMMGTEGNADPRSFWQANLDEAVGRLVAEIRAFRPDVYVCYDAFGGYGHPDHLQAHRVGLLAVEAAAVSALYADAGTAWRARKVYFSALPKSAIFRFSQALREWGTESPFGEFDRVEDVPMGVPDDEVTTAVNVAVWMDRKRAAMRAHASQIGPDSFFLNVPEEWKGEAFSTEWFVRVRGVGPAEGMEDDLFAGLRP